MTLKIARICVIVCACACALSATRARAEEGGGGHERVKTLPFLHEILNHAEELSLSADQKAKLNEFGELPMPKSRQEFSELKRKIFTLLSKDQTEKVENLYKKMREENREREHRVASDDNDDHK